MSPFTICGCLAVATFGMPAPTEAAVTAHATSSPVDAGTAGALSARDAADGSDRAMAQSNADEVRAMLGIGAQQQNTSAAQLIIAALVMLHR
ncbi:hypothetical protein FHR53_000667 [Xanthomonas arboricola]